MYSRFPVTTSAASARRIGRGLAMGAVACAALLGGCVVRDDQAVTRLRFSIWGSVAQQKIEQRIVDAFEREHPDIRVDVITIGAQRYQEKIQAMMVGGIQPDLMMVNHQEYDDWAVRGQLADLTQLQRELQANLTLMAGPRKVFERDGRFFALPVNGHGFVTFVNLDAFAAAGIPVPDEGFTWEQIRQFGPRLSRRAGSKVARTDYVCVIANYYALYPPLVEMGGAIFDDPYHPTRAAVDSPAGAAWITWLREMEDSGYVAPGALVPPDLVTYDLFRDERVALYFVGRWQVPDLAGNTKFRWDVRPFPAGPKGRVTWHGGTAIAISSQTRQARAARAFARFYAGRVGAEISMAGGRTVPVYREIAEDPAFLRLRPPDSPQVFVDTMNPGTAAAWLYAPGVQDVWNLINYRVQQALADRRLSAETVVRLLGDDLDRWLDRQRKKQLIAPSPLSSDVARIAPRSPRVGPSDALANDH